MAIGFQFIIITLFSLFSAPSLTFAFVPILPRFPSSAVSAELKQRSHSSQNGLYRTKFFTQILDHFNFNPQSNHTFQQRYLINDTFWGGAKNNAPIFVYTGNEGNIEWFTQNTGFMFENAPSFQALLVFIEHRFYGKSIPFGGNKTVAYANTSTLGYLSSTQALADYATLIIDLKKNLSATDSPVVVFGGSYGGMLAAWFRMKYPHVAIGALASSAPILHFMGLVSPDIFNNIITQDFRSESENCYKVIKGSWDLIDDTANKPGGMELLRKTFRICKSDDFGPGSLEGWLRAAWIYTAMTDYPTPSNFLNPLPAYPVKKMCEAIDSSVTGNNRLAKLHAAASVYYNYTGKARCFDLDDNSDPHDLGGWQWQKYNPGRVEGKNWRSSQLGLENAYYLLDFSSIYMLMLGIQGKHVHVTASNGEVKSSLTQSC
ncbi:lysosomal Pro-X carboxypeptidase-like isoform X2 [Glycine soja]|uniref:lysosomal Pro-X carboxypeptidase-like isoform X2 n=1 Tax=Glycine soja TaxID=3848 RepID=UPI001038AC7B|nr:lysosomal Pro-X carboxypeptidase-like isoform X2 [Glycine soja]